MTRPAGPGRGRAARGALAAVLAAALAGPLAAQDATVTIVAFNDSTLQATREAPAGLVRFRFTNRSRDVQNMQLVAVAGGRSAEEAVAAMRAGVVPDWLALAGGVGPLAPGLTASVSLLLPAGTYLLAGTLPGADGLPRHRRGLLAVVTLTGTPRRDAVLATDGIVSVTDAGFRMLRIMVRGGREQVLDPRLSTLPTRPGERIYRVENAGRLTHELVVLRAETPQAMREWADGRHLAAGVVPVGGIAQQPPGQRAWAHVRLEAGSYFLFCAIRHRAGLPGYQTGEVVQLVVR